MRCNHGEGRLSRFFRHRRINGWFQADRSDISGFVLALRVLEARFPRQLFGFEWFRRRGELPVDIAKQKPLFFYLYHRAL